MMFHNYNYKEREDIGFISLNWLHRIWICWIKTWLYKLSPCRSIRKYIWTWHKNGQSPPSVIIWRNLAVPHYLMLYTKFQCYRHVGSWEGDIWRFLSYMGLDDTLVMRCGSFEHIFIPTSHGCSIWNLASNSLVSFFRKRSSKIWIWVTLYKCHWITLTLDCHKSSCTHLLTTYIHRLQ